ncbi:MAG: nitrogen regulation protein NR(II) [bacterium]
MAGNIWRKIKKQTGAPANLDEKLLRRRKVMVIGIVALTVMILFGFILGSWKFLQNMELFLEKELGTRLRSVATLTSNIIAAKDFSYYLESDNLEFILSSLQHDLRQVHQDNQLQGVYLVDKFYRTLAASPDIFTFGDRLTFVEEDSLALDQALSGIAVAAPLQLVAGNRFKNAYAPVFGSLGDVAAIVVVQASADFFDLLRVFQRGLIFGGLVSVALAVLFSVFLFWAIQLLIKTNESLRKTERLAAMGQMAATVAHEIRNPLGIIKSTADVLQSKYESKEEPDELFEFIPSEVRRLNRLVSDFLAFARDRELEANATDLQKTVEKTLSTLEEEIKQAQVKLSFETEALEKVIHDEDAVGQVMLNLILNAIQSMNGGGELRIRLHNETKKGKPLVAVAVQDTGCGFEGDPEQIFEPFFTTKTSGSGLGLAICKRLIEKHQGWIEVESKKKQGTTMRFHLPASVE